jgi:hypothetical protein
MPAIDDVQFGLGHIAAIGFRLRRVERLSSYFPQITKRRGAFHASRPATWGRRRRSSGLAIHKPEQAFDPERLIEVATVDQNFRFRPVCKHAVHLERFFFLFDPPSHH